MGLKQDLTELADRLKGAMRDDETLRETAVEVAAELRGIAKGLPDEQQSRLVAPGTDWQDVAKLKAEMESRQVKIRERQNEAMAAGMVLCVGGPADDTHIAVNGEAPVGSKVRVCGALYELRPDGKLYFVGGSAEAGL